MCCVTYCVFLGVPFVLEDYKIHFNLTICNEILKIICKTIKPPEREY